MPFRPLDPSPDGIIVCVRKRPIAQHEVTNCELDCVTASNPFAIVHETLVLERWKPKKKGKKCNNNVINNDYR